MAGSVSFWQRMSRMFRSANGSADGDGSKSTVETLEPGTDTPAGALKAAPGVQGVSWWRRPGRAVQAREVALHVTQLADAMQQHFRQQDQRASELAGSLNRVGCILEQLAEAQRSQGEYLGAIAEHTELAGKNTAALNATLGRVPESLLAQADAIRTVARQLEIAQEADTQLMHSLQQFGRAVDTLGSSGTAQVEVLQRLNAAQQEQCNAFTALVREQSRRFAAVFMVAAILAILALAGLGATLALRLAR